MLLCVYKVCVRAALLGRSHTVGTSATRRTLRCVFVRGETYNCAPAAAAASNAEDRAGRSDVSKRPALLSSPPEYFASLALSIARVLFFMCYCPLPLFYLFLAAGPST